MFWQAIRICTAKMEQKVRKFPAFGYHRQRHLKLHLKRSGISRKLDSKTCLNNFVTTNTVSLLFQNGRYDQAIESYSRGMKCDPSNAMLPANRAMALLKKGRHREAEVDCTLALSLDPTYVKAYQRRATARASLKLYQQGKFLFVNIDLESF